MQDRRRVPSRAGVAQGTVARACARSDPRQQDSIPRRQRSVKSQCLGLVPDLCFVAGCASVCCGLYRVENCSSLSRYSP